MKIIQSIGIYTISRPTSGGKAGKGMNKTSSIQVRKKQGMANFLVKQIRYSTNNDESYDNAVGKARAWILEQA